MEEWIYWAMIVAGVVVAGLLIAWSCGAFAPAAVAVLPVFTL
ncbi:hypothetical protein [Methanoregula sp. UBA64]|jgi:hypothetical protein|nr:hypothetical protein [Methanoregula sp. UBA64]